MIKKTKSTGNSDKTQSLFPRYITEKVKKNLLQSLFTKRSIIQKTVLLEGENQTLVLCLNTVDSRAHFKKFIINHSISASLTTQG